MADEPLGVHIVENSCGSNADFWDCEKFARSYLFRPVTNLGPDSSPAVVCTTNA